MRGAFRPREGAHRPAVGVSYCVFGFRLLTVFRIWTKWSPHLELMTPKKATTTKKKKLKAILWILSALCAPFCLLFERTPVALGAETLHASCLSGTLVFSCVLL